MKTAAIKSLVEQHTLQQLELAEMALLEEQNPGITIEGDDEGERLTHILAAIYIKKQMDEKGLAFNMALRDFSQRVRKSIG